MFLIISKYSYSDPFYHFMSEFEFEKETKRKCVQDRHCSKFPNYTNGKFASFFEKVLSIYRTIRHLWVGKLVLQFIVHKYLIIFARNILIAFLDL